MHIFYNDKVPPPVKFFSPLKEKAGFSNNYNFRKCTDTTKNTVRNLWKHHTDTHL